jgi:hypothetical protein
MKKSLSLAVIAAVFTAPAFAANLENPLYIPKTGEVYTKTGAGIMYKKTDDSLAMQAKNHAGEIESPILRISENLGYGITDRLSVRGIFGYTQNNDIDRKGLHEGRVGLNYRMFDGSTTDGFVWDIYADAFLGGASQMEADLVASPNSLGGTYPMSFNYDNYTNGRWGAWFGTQVGKTWDKFTGAAYVEVERTFGNNNNEIVISDSAKSLVQGMVFLATGSAPVAAAYAAGLPESFTVDTKSTWEYAGGLKGIYELDSDWSVGGGLSFRHRAANEIEAVNLTNSSTVPTPAIVAALTNSIASSFIGSLKDEMDEYTLTAAVSRQLTESTQVSLYGEYTFDNAGVKSQNATDVKAEAGVRVNVAF